jgi:hypothetical protein
MAFSWKRTTIQTDDGTRVEAVAPVIISASRATDIPAFYADWLLARLRRGYIRWENPFNRAAPQYVALSEARLIVFWSKNPLPLLPHLDELDRRGLNYYFQFTVNDYETEGLEPGVPPLDKRLETFRQLARRLGPERVIWRFDPLVLTATLTPEALMEKVRRVGDALHAHTRKLVISFADMDYPKVCQNLARAGIRPIVFTEPSMRDLAERLAAMNRERWGLEIASCAEKVDLSPYGISHNRCIDDELIVRCFRADTRLMDFLGMRPEPGDLFATDDPAAKKGPSLKDKGQRAACGCIVSKDIGQYNTCPHLCVYCYANHTAELVKKNYTRHTTESDAIVVPAPAVKS